jgi:LuxR family maltose regulon positive regulatory protein
MRGKGQLSELRVSDLRFTQQEAASFLNEMMKLNLSNENIAALETRTEGWIAGLQLAAISMNGNQNSSSFIESFTGSHYFVLDYLIEEVLNQQTGDIQSFLIRTSILERLSGPLCDAVLNDREVSGFKTLKYLEQLNMFIIPLDSERLWYRYHHLFAELLRQKLQSSRIDTSELHLRASRWFEDNKMYLEAFQHSTAANDIERTIRLLEGEGIPRTSRRTVSLILNWLQSLPEEVLNSKPILWITFGSVLLGMGQITGVEEKLLAAEKILSETDPDGFSRDLIGRIASMRAIIAVTGYNPEAIYKQSLKALKYLDSSNFSSRTTSTWTLGQAFEQKGDLSEAKKTYLKAISIGRSSRNFLFTIISEAGLGDLLEGENKLHEAADMYKNVLEQAGNQPLPVLCDVYLGLARINYQWNNLEEARSLGEKGLHLARKFEKTIDRFIVMELFLVQLAIAEGDLAQASSLLSGTAKTVQQELFKHRKRSVAEMQIQLKIKQGHFKEAAYIVVTNNLPLCRTRLFLADGNAVGALKALEPVYLGIDDEIRGITKLRIKILQSLALYDSGEKKIALQIISEILIDLEPECFVRIFVDEGLPMHRLLSEAAAQGIMQDYTASILSEFNSKNRLAVQPLIEPLSQRELDVLDLLSKGLSNKEICDKLFIALDTVKGHNRRIFAKLDVKTRTMAISKARDLKIIR